jgi:DNA polymerase-3 subunit beta
VQHEGELPEDAPEALGVIIPSKTIAVLTKCLGDDPVAITASNSHIHFHTGKAEILSRLVDGAYPDYQRVIPKERDRRATVNREEMLATLDRVATFAKDDTRGVKLVPIAEALVLRTAQANDEVEAEIEGKFPSIAFNQKKVASVLSVLKCKRVEIYANDAGAPAVIIDPAMPNDIHVVMPLRMN